MESNIKTYNDLLESLKLFTPEQLQQNCSVIIDDESMAKEIKSVSIISEDIYINKDDTDDLGSLKDLKEMHREDFERDDYVLSTTAGRIFLYSF